MTDQDRNTEQIREFLSRGPVIRMDISLSGIPSYLLDPDIQPPDELVPVDPSSVKITTDAEIIYDERDNPSQAWHDSPHGISIRGFSEEFLTPKLQDKITEYLTESLGPMLGSSLDEATLKQPIETCSAFFEGLKVAGVVEDYGVFLT